MPFNGPRRPSCNRRSLSALTLSSAKRELRYCVKVEVEIEVSHGAKGQTFWRGCAWGSVGALRHDDICNDEHYNERLEDHQAEDEPLHNLGFRGVVEFLP